MRACALAAVVLTMHAVVITGMQTPREPSGRGRSTAAPALTVRNVAWVPASEMTLGTDAGVALSSNPRHEDRIGVAPPMLAAPPATEASNVRPAPDKPTPRSVPGRVAPRPAAPRALPTRSEVHVPSKVPVPSKAPVQADVPVQAEAFRAPLPDGPSPSATDEVELSAGENQALALQDALRSLPSYPVRLPPSERLRFRVTRGDASGEGVLDWTLDGSRYRAALRVHGEGLPGLYWTSEGDAASTRGAAPRRMVAHRKGRPYATATFEADARKVSFTGARVEQPFALGGQDRLSWMLQLAGVLEARERPLRDDERIVLYVVGPRGSAELWQLRMVGRETLVDANGATPVVKLVREAQRLYDTEIEVWLDPARHHLPARWRQQQRGVPRAPLEWERLPG